MMYPLVLDLAADGVPVTVTCRVLEFSTQAFYKWRRNPVTQRDWDDAHLINAAHQIHADDPAFGYRFIADDSARRITAGENRVARLCTQERIWSVFAKPGLTENRSASARRPRKRQFTAHEANRWPTALMSTSALKVGPTTDLVLRRESYGRPDPGTAGGCRQRS